MSQYDYEASKEVTRHGFPFYALIMAAMRQADSDNAAKLREAFPAVWTELHVRYNSPGGLLPEETA